MHSGKVIFFNTKSRFGFIKDSDTNTDYYFYIKDASVNFLAEQKVTFDIREAKRGMEAFNVKAVS